MYLLYLLCLQILWKIMIRNAVSEIYLTSPFRFSSLPISPCLFWLKLRNLSLVCRSYCASADASEDLGHKECHLGEWHRRCHSKWWQAVALRIFCNFVHCNGPMALKFRFLAGIKHFNNNLAYYCWHCMVVVIEMSVAVCLSSPPLEVCPCTVLLNVL